MSAFYFARMMSDIPIDLLLPTVFINLVYWMGAPPSICKLCHLSHALHDIGKASQDVLCPRHCAQQ